MRRKLRRNGIVLLMLLGALLMSACSTTTGDAETNNDDDANNKVKDGGTLIVARQADAMNMDPHFITNNNTADVHHGKIYETLVEFDQGMEIVPRLAESWEQLDDTTWEFKLNEGVEFHDGTPFNAEAVKETFNRVLDPEVGSPERDKLSMIEEVKVIDDYTVQLLLSEPYSPLLSILSSQEASILNPEIIKNDPDALSDEPNGTGPFEFKEWNSGKDITLVKNENYWGDEAMVSEIIFKIVPEDATRLSMIETGEAHIADQVPINDIERIEEGENTKIERVEGLAVEFLGFNMESDIFGDEKLRKAVSHAIEREAIIDGVYNNVGTVSNSAMSPKVVGHSDDVIPYEYDINKGKELVEESGFDTNEEVTLLTNDSKSRVDMAEVIQSQLKEIGLDVKIQTLEAGSFTDALHNGESDMFINGWGNATGDGDYNQYNLFHTDSQGSAGNSFFYSNQEVDKLIEAGRATADLDERDEIYEKTQKVELEDAVYVPIRNAEAVVAANEQIQDFKLTPLNYLDLGKATLTE